MTTEHGIIKVSLRDLKATKLLLWELGEVERELRLAGHTASARRLDEARGRFHVRMSRSALADRIREAREYMAEHGIEPPDHET